MANKRIQKRIYDKLNSTPLPPSGTEPPKSSAIGGRAVGSKHEHTHTKNGTDPIDSTLNKAAIALTTRGDIMFRNATVSTRLAKGTEGHVLTMGASDPAWTAPDGGDIGEGYINIPAWNYDSIGQGTWVVVMNTLQIYAGVFNNSSFADGDNISYKVFLAAGTYTLDVHTMRNTNMAIIDIDIAGVEVASYDAYGTVLLNVKQKTTGIVIATAGIKDIKVRTDGKNGSSTAYNTHFSSISLWRTA
ncbi:hypothetical protein LCGC14_2480820 [marine sediment metagenome]|uniref:Uncharacterized protein n=1 Tax=marine sediment metagenome TaxID=412755 RepID=A0A0F9B8F9_9ZZZZ